MTDEDLGFWTTAAQLVVVLVFALIVEHRVAWNGTHPDRGWRSFKGMATTQVLLSTGFITAAFLICLVALSSGKSSAVQVNWVCWALISAFITVVLAPILDVVLTIWRQPEDPNNPEPKSRRQLAREAKKRNASETKSKSA